MEDQVISSRFNKSHIDALQYVVTKQGKYFIRDLDLIDNCMMF